MNKKLSFILRILVVVVIIILVGVYLKDLHDDYKCSTEDDMELFVKNGCMKYVERGLK